jgi:hypothetical protein
MFRSRPICPGTPEKSVMIIVASPLRLDWTGINSRGAIEEEVRVGKMTSAVKRSALKLGMIPADGIGKEVLPVS